MTSLIPKLASSLMNAEHERIKYRELYHHKAYAFYGHSNHGERAHDLVSKMLNEAQNKSLLDVGCGWNEFVQQFRERHPDKKALGADFACPGADLIACATRIPVENKSIGVLTAFDMLEHMLPEQVSLALTEFARVAEGFVFSISHVPSRVKWNGETLHPTVQPIEWWMFQIMRAGGFDIRQTRGFITGKWGNAVWNPLSSPSCILVGNGPGVLSADGKWIDSHDEVVRFNRYRTKGFEDHVGTKTTLWSTFGHGYLPGDENQRPKRIIFVHGERGEPVYQADELYRIPRWLYSHCNQKVQTLGKPSAGLSSGLLVAIWLLEVVGLNKIHLVGFDHFRKDKSPLHHYYNLKPYGRPPELDGDAEAAILKKYVTEKRVYYF